MIQALFIVAFVVVLVGMLPYLVLASLREWPEWTYVVAPVTICALMAAAGIVYG